MRTSCEYHHSYHIPMSNYKCYFFPSWSPRLYEMAGRPTEVLKHYDIKTNYLQRIKNPRYPRLVRVLHVIIRHIYNFFEFDFLGKNFNRIWLEFQIFTFLSKGATYQDLKPCPHTLIDVD